MCKDIESAENAFGDYTDGKNIGDWKSRYPFQPVQVWIIFEAVYLVVLLIGALWLSLDFKCRGYLFFEKLSLEQYSEISRYVYAITGGIVGSAVFGIKWLVHVVAHGFWHEDRKLWRILLPFSSSAIALIFVVIIESRIFNVLNPEVIKDNKIVFALSCLVGLFSDRVLVKLNDIANSIFGPSKKDDKDKGIKTKS